MSPGVPAARSGVHARKEGEMDDRLEAKRPEDEEEDDLDWDDDDLDDEDDDFDEEEDEEEDEE
jgi:hypothetical protein